MWHMGSRTFGLGGVTAFVAGNFIDTIPGVLFTCALCSSPVEWGVTVVIKKEGLPDDAIDTCTFCASKLTGKRTHYV